MIEGKEILITGGAGFIGSSLASRLKEGNRVILYDNFYRNALPAEVAQHSNVTVIRGDVLDAAAVARVARNAQYVIHLASIAGVDTVMKRPVETMRVSILGTINVLDALLDNSRLERFIDFSTSEVFGQYAYKVTEGDSTHLGAVGEARWTYAVSKLATEHLALSCHKQFGLPAVSIRPFNIYGPNQVGEGAVHHFIVAALKGEDLIIHNDGSQIRSWCYIDDIVNGILLAMERPQAVGHAFNIGNPRATVTIYNLAALIVRLSKSTSKLKLVKWDFPDVELRIPNIQKARELLGFEPKVDLEEGLERTIAWYSAKLKEALSDRS